MKKAYVELPNVTNFIESQSNLARIERGQNITLNTLDAYARLCGKNVRVKLV